MTLLPCPFCGSSARITPTWRVRCSNDAKHRYSCPLSTVDFPSEEQWNNRADGKSAERKSENESL